MTKCRFLVVGLVAAGMTIPVSGGLSPVWAQAGDAASGGSRSSVMDRIRAKMKEMKKPENTADRWFENLDADKNQEITKNELFESLRRRFARLDANGDGLVSRDEYLRERSDGNLGASRFGALDSDKDGRLTMTEFSSPADWRFDRIDRNLDGKITRTEAQRLFDRPKGRGEMRESDRCFYVDRQIIRVDEEAAEKFEKRGYPKADCQWIPDSTQQEKAGKLAR